MSNAQAFTEAAPLLRPPEACGSSNPSTSVRALSPVVPYELLIGALDEVGYGLVLFDADGEVRWANRVALRSLRCSSTLRLDRQRLMAYAADDGRVLQRAMAAALQGRRTMTRIGRGEGVTMLALVPLPASANADGGPCAMLVMSRRDQCEPLSLQFFASEHKLTRAEASVLEALSRGNAPSQVAASGRVELSTVRSQISSVREKTGAASVNHLLRILACLPPLVSTVDDRPTTK